MDKVERMQNLVGELNRYSYEYYTMSNPSVSDKEYDEKYNELLSLEKEYNTVLPNSPTHRIGDIVLGEFEKHEHKFKCYSMDKIQNDFNELVIWHNKVQSFTKQNNLPKIQYVVMKKFDGLTINNTHNNNGDFEYSATRGTGEIGELVTEQVKTIKTIPLKINNDFIIEVHGEALMSKKAFKRYNEIAEVPLKNLRNGAAGALKNLDTKETAKRNLSAFFYDIGYSEGKTFETYMEMMDFIKEMGFPIDNEYYLCDTIEEVKEKIKVIEELRPNLEYEIDGVIISVNDIKTRELMGYTEKYPRWAIAYKYESEETTTKLLDIEFNVGRTGKITPRGILEPVELMGATVSYATLNNIDDIKRKGVRIGAEVFIRRSNDVIPEILGVIEDSVTEDMIEVEMPKNCPCCNSELEQDGAHYFCRNKNCTAKQLKKFVHFVSKECMNVDGLSTSKLERLISKGWIKSFSDIYRINIYKNNIIALERFGEDSYNNLWNAIQDSRNVKLENFLVALGIPNIGKKASKTLSKYFDGKWYNIESALNDNFDFTSLKDYGETMHDSIYNWYKSDEYYELDNLMPYMKFILPQEKQETGLKNLSGLTFVITGSVITFKNRDDFKELVESLNGSVSGSVSKNTNFLVNNDVTSTSGKNKKAKELNVNIITELDFNKMIGRI